MHNLLNSQLTKMFIIQFSPANCTIIRENWFFFVVNYNISCVILITWVHNDSLLKVVFGQSRCEFREKDDGVEYKEKLITNYVLKVETNTKLSLDFRPFLSHRALC